MVQNMVGSGSARWSGQALKMVGENSLENGRKHGRVRLGKMFWSDWAPCTGIVGKMVGSGSARCSGQALPLAQAVMRVCVVVREKEGVERGLLE